MTHHHHVMFESAYFCIMCILKFIDELPVHGMSLKDLLFLQDDEDLIYGCPPSERGILDIPRLVCLTYNHVLICLSLKHRDLPTGI